MGGWGTRLRLVLCKGRCP
ncbi:hypothetical protein SAMN02745702_02980, partial [Desulfobaculum bizertense DSM 18034]